MLDVFRFKRTYAKMKDRHLNAAGEWEITLADVRVLLNALPMKVVKQFGQRHIQYLKKYSGRVYYENVDVLIDNIRIASAQIRAGEYLDTEAHELKLISLNEWVQPTQLGCNFGYLITDAQQTFSELVDAFNQAPDEKANYYRRKTIRIVSDVFSLVELMAELIVAGRKLDA